MQSPHRPAAPVPEAVRSALIAALLRDVHPSVRAWDPVGAQQGVEARAETELRRCSDPEFAAGFARSVPVAGATPDDYLQRLIELPGGHFALVGIRFKGLDREWAFVDLVAATAPWAEVRDALLVRLPTLYPRFAPGWLRVFLPVGEPGVGVVRPDLRQIAGPLAALHARPLPAGFDRMVVHAARDLAWRDDYDALYRQFHREAPELRDEVLPSEPADLSDCVHADQLWLASVDGEWAGVVGARPEADGALRGWCVVEEILGRGFRGRGLGAALQRHLIARLPAEGLLHGTIHPSNIASLRVAARCGREDVGGWWFVRAR
ncbi:MAG: RimJ/RimL family protein N-acetyltransferase [Myxococcota bacterium]|jgi:RimJ/RimL family protein N-acetyltransferase